MEKLKVGVIGGTGMVGQRYVTLIANHPWFELSAIAASARSAGKTYEEAVGAKWALDEPMPECAKSIVVKNAADVADVVKDVDFVFSAVDMKKEEILALEEEYAKAECPVVSNNSANRWTPDVPMVIPEINPEHLAVIESPLDGIGVVQPVPARRDETGFVIAQREEITAAVCGDRGFAESTRHRSRQEVPAFEKAQRPAVESAPHDGRAIAVVPRVARLFASHGVERDQQFAVVEFEALRTAGGAGEKGLFRVVRHIESAVCAPAPGHGIHRAVDRVARPRRRDEFVVAVEHARSREQKPPRCPVVERGRIRHRDFPSLSARKRTARQIRDFADRKGFPVDGQSMRRVCVGSCGTTCLTESNFRTGRVGDQDRLLWTFAGLERLPVVPFLLFIPRIYIP